MAVLKSFKLDANLDNPAGRLNHQTIKIMIQPHKTDFIKMMSPHICLNMIVKNEAAVILRCLASVKPWIDSWVIVDTGSTDGTQDMIRQYMHDLPGQLFERPWKNFGHNRSEALELALTNDLPPADYLLFIDADETLLVAEHFRYPELDGAAYYFECLYDHVCYQRNALVSTRLPWRWKGVLHEYLDSPMPHHWQTLEGIRIFVQHDSARGKDATTYLKDIALLQQGIRDEPDNLRYQFYLAQSYQDAGMLEAALQAYQQRANAAGWEEERWMAQFRAAQLTERLNYPIEHVYLAYLQAWISRQQRAEPLYELARFYRERQLYDTACYFAQQAVNIVQPDDLLFVDHSVYAWRVLDELSVSATYCAPYKPAGQAAMLKLIQQQKFPLSEKARIEANVVFYDLSLV